MEKSPDLQARALARAILEKRRTDIEKTDEWKKARALGKLFARIAGHEKSEAVINHYARFFYSIRVFSLPDGFVWLDAQEEAERQAQEAANASKLDSSASADRQGAPGQTTEGLAPEGRRELSDGNRDEHSDSYSAAGGELRMVSTPNRVLPREQTSLGCFPRSAGSVFLPEKADVLLTSEPGPGDEPALECGPYRLVRRVRWGGYSRASFLRQRAHTALRVRRGRHG
jgi:hypothetical protein